MISAAGWGLQIRPLSGYFALIHLHYPKRDEVILRGHNRCHDCLLPLLLNGAGPVTFGRIYPLPPLLLSEFNLSSSGATAEVVALAATAVGPLFFAALC
jgi:hypothetical protein